MEQVQGNMTVWESWHTYMKFQFYTVEQLRFPCVSKFWIMKMLLEKKKMFDSDVRFLSKKDVSGVAAESVLKA